MGVPFWETSTFWTAVSAIVAIAVALGNFINWRSKRHELARRKERESQSVNTQPTYSHDKELTLPGHEETPSPVPRRELSMAQDAILNWWADYSYDGRISTRSDEFDLDLHYRNEELAHNTRSYIAYITEVDNVYTFDIPEVRRKAIQLSKAVKEQGYDGGRLFVIFKDDFAAQHGKNFLNSEPAEDVLLYTGYLEDSRFELVNNLRN